MTDHTISKINHGDIELDKTEDGRYWRLLHWVGDDVVLQLRIGHTTQDDPDDLIMEMKRLGPDDLDAIRREINTQFDWTARRSWGLFEEGFTTLSEFMYCAVELEDAEPDLDGFPDTFRNEFITMVRYWGRVLEMMECGPAMGTLSPSALKAEKAASLGMSRPGGARGVRQGPTSCLHLIDAEKPERRLPRGHPATGAAG